MSSVKRVVLKRLNGNYTLADDITQETFLSLWKSKDKFEIRDKQTIKALLCRVLQRRIADYFRNKKNHEYPIDIRDDNIGIVYGAGHRLMTFYNQQYCNQQCYSSTLYNKEIESALNTLPCHMRNCIILVLVEGYTHKEVANKLNIPLGTVLSRVSRGRKHLYKLLKGIKHGY